MPFLSHPFNAMDVVSVFKVLKQQDNLLFLDSADHNHPDSRYSYVMCNPQAIIKYQDDALILADKNGQQSIDNKCIFSFLNDYIQLYAVDKNDVEAAVNLPPFRGGLAGYFGYDLGRSLENLPALASYDPELPDMVVGLYECLYAYDHKSEQGYILAHGETENETQAKLDSFKALILEYHKNNDTALPQRFEPVWRENFTKNSYEAAIQKTINYIHAGDIFQANITRRFDAALPAGFDPLAHYLHLRDVNPAPFAAYFAATDDLVLSSASPERFLSVNTQGKVQTKPIKGTRPVIQHDPAANQAQIDDLLDSEKDRAENIMIVDLLRNDLSKTCMAESVQVDHLCALESFASVHHLVSTVTGHLKPDYTALDVLKGCFPGGSITGAPKIRAMEIIEELEPTRRGPYCGSLGYIGFDGAMDVNILIRTLVYWKGSVSFQVGGGIVADSDPAAEFDETLTKAAGLLRSFNRGI